MKKKVTAVLYVLMTALLLLTLVGCGTNTPNDTSANKKVTIYTTLFPLMDFARQIGGEHVEVRSIIPAGAETHDFEPTAKDIIAINEADMFIYNGAGYETWIHKMVEHLSDTVVIEASRDLTLLEAEPHAHDDDDEAHSDTHGAHAYDPHVWLDPMNAKMQANHILTALIAFDPAHQAEYQANFDHFVVQLDALDSQFQEAMDKATKHEVVVSHQAFGYLAARYGFEQIPISGLSPSNEPSAKALQQLIELMKVHDVNYIAFDGLVESKVAKTVQREAGAEAVTLYTIENVTKDQLEQGVTYLHLMEKNLESLRKVLEVQ